MVLRGLFICLACVAGLLVWYVGPVGAQDDVKAASETQPDAGATAVADAGGETSGSPEAPDVKGKEEVAQEQKEQEQEDEEEEEPLTLENVKAAADEAALAGHNAWMLTCCALVLFMTAPGLAMFYSGLVRKKNVLGVMMQCVFLMGLMTVIWALWGYSLGLRRRASGRGSATASYLFMNDVAVGRGTRTAGAPVDADGRTQSRG